MINSIDKPELRGNIQAMLEEAFIPIYLEVIDESGMHNVPKGSESHFKVLVVSSAFEKCTRLERHRLIHLALAKPLETIHALSIVAYSPSEWVESGNKVPQSPKCLGGSKH
jgi:BolA protein